jgi:lipid II:glycine glycyltransferase (peptidoglycan interpeptide bridge formation enzyme)
MNRLALGQATAYFSDDPHEVYCWNQFLRQCPDAHIEQTIGWGKLKQINGWKPTWFWVTRRCQIIGGAMILTRPAGRFATIGYVERGPICDFRDEGTMNLVVSTLRHLVRRMGLAYLVIAPPYAGSALVPLLESMRFRRKPDTFQPTGVGKATLLIDLLKDENQLLAEMSMTKRQNLRRATRKGVRIRLGDGADAATMRDLMRTACKRRGISPAPHQEDFFSILWRELGPSGLAKFFIAEVDGHPVSAATLHVFAGTAQLWRVGWSGTHEKHNPNDLLHWEMIRWAKQNGCRTFDFMHIPLEHAQAILRGERVKDSYSGVTEFKTSFGGQIVVLPDLYYRSYMPLVQLAFDLGAAPILESRAFHNFFRKTISGS